MLSPDVMLIIVDYMHVQDIFNGRLISKYYQLCIDKKSISNLLSKLYCEQYNVNPPVIVDSLSAVALLFKQYEDQARDLRSVVSVIETVELMGVVRHFDLEVDLSRYKGRYLTWQGIHLQGEVLEVIVQLLHHNNVSNVALYDRLHKSFKYGIKAQFRIGTCNIIRGLQHLDLDAICDNFTEQGLAFINEYLKCKENSNASLIYKKFRWI